MTLKKSLIATATVLAMGSCFADDGAYAQNSRQPVAVSLSAQNDQGMQGGGAKSMFRQGQDPLDASKGGYSAPARIDTHGKWDVNLTGSFIYWNAYQDGLDVTTEGTTNAARTAFTTASGEVEHHESKYKPGFKVNLGMSSADFDDWIFNVQYTWLHSKTETSRSDSDELEAFNTSNWFFNQANTFSAGASSEWDLHFRLLDVTAARPYYSGRRLTVTPFGGLRFAWIKQQFEVRMTQLLSMVAGNAPIVQNAESDSKSNSWAVGPIGGVNCNWLLGHGFRSIGNASAGILYTRYTSISNSQTVTDTLAPSGPVGGKYNEDYNALRPFIEFDLGLGWGTYCYDNDFYVDFQASYDFLVFCDQNMMRQLADDMSSRTGHAPGNLWLQGLTVSVRFDF